MGRKTILIDDLDGTELPEDTKPVDFILGRTAYSIYLSDDNHGKFLEALNPYIANAESGAWATKTAAAKPSSGSSANKEKMKKVREWAQATGFKFKDAQGNEKTLGDRGRIPDEVVEAYEVANPE